MTRTRTILMRPVGGLPFKSQPGVNNPRLGPQVPWTDRAVRAGCLKLDEVDGTDIGVLQGGLQDLIGRQRIQVENGQRSAIPVAAAK